MRGGAQLCSCFPSAWCRPHLAQSLLTPLGRSGPSSEGQVHLGTAGASNKLWPFPMSPNPEKEDGADMRQHQQTRPTPAWTATCMDTGAATDRDPTARVCARQQSQAAPALPFSTALLGAAFCPVRQTLSSRPIPPRYSHVPPSFALELNKAARRSDSSLGSNLHMELQLLQLLTSMERLLQGQEKKLKILS